MEPIQYVRTIRRRWKIIAAFVALGLVLGYISSIGAEKKHDETTYWRATYTLYYDGSAVTDKGGPYTQLGQMGLLATGGAVPAQIAGNRGVNATALSARIATETNTAQSTVKITATGQDAEDTVALATEVGDGLMKFVTDQNQAAYDKDVQDALNKVDGLKRQIAEIDATNPAPNSVEASQREALSNQLRLALDNELQIASQGAPKPILNPFQPPEAIPINGSQFAKFVRAGALERQQHHRRGQRQELDRFARRHAQPEVHHPHRSDPPLPDRWLPRPAHRPRRRLRVGAPRQPGAVEGRRRAGLRAARAVRGATAHPGAGAARPRSCRRPTLCRAQPRRIGPCAHRWCSSTTRSTRRHRLIPGPSTRRSSS